MNILKEYSLRRHNTFGIDATADWFISYDNVEDLHTLVRDEYFQECRYLHVGEGSNLLFLANFHGIVLCSQIKTIELLADEDRSVTLRVGAGMIWDDFVAYAVEHGYYGVENLSLIPGQVGSAAIQNIGAYGVEVDRLVVRVHALHRRTGQEKAFEHSEMCYTYRYSAFKEAEMMDWIVTYVDLKLAKQGTLSLEYADVQRYFAELDIEPTLSSLRDAVIAIRRAKLPDPEVLGNAGSFFTNPIVDDTKLKALLAEYPSMPYYPLPDGRSKLAAGWLIDQAGYRGHRSGSVGTYERQALVLVNYGGATGQDVANLAIEIQQAIQARYGVEIHPEVRYIS